MKITGNMIKLEVLLGDPLKEYLKEKYINEKNI